MAAFIEEHIRTMNRCRILAGNVQGHDWRVVQILPMQINSTLVLWFLTF
jgi:hypothetical protein